VGEREAGRNDLAKGTDSKTVSMRGPAGLPDVELDSRYDSREYLSAGGQGDIYRVFDRRLRRQVVMKILDRALADDPISVSRFIQEAQVTAQLQHPAIVPVHDIGTLPDGRPYYTMTEVRGRTLATVIDDVHAASAAGWAIEAGGIGFGRMIDMFERVCEAVGYAHARGVIHRDLKPQNVMIGPFGEVIVLDWGVARVLGQPPEPTPVSSIRQDSTSLTTEVGSVVGTRGYMPPEQLGGEDTVPASDVYALGMILREILTGARVSIPLPITQVPERPVPVELVAVFERAVAPDPAARYPEAKELAHVVASFLDGDRRRERARALLAEARAMQPRIATLRDRATATQRAARVILDPLPPFADAALKAPGWKLDDEARALFEQADLATFEMTQLADSALNETDLPEAHELLADHYRALHEAAESAGDPSASRLEVLLRSHERGKYAAYLGGRGTITLRTDPPGAEIELRRYELRDRRLVDEHVTTVAAPLESFELAHGSYLAILRAPGHHDVRYPIAIGRHEDFVVQRPGTTAPTPIVLPPLGAIADDEIYVAGGPFSCGGDPQAAGEVMPRQRVWIDSFVMRRHPVTNRELLAMVNALVDEHNPASEAIALAVVPRHRGTTASEAGAHVWPRDDHGHFLLGRDDEGVTWEPDAPAFMVNWHGALQFAAWLSRKTGKPYRLPGELELEKAARGADARAFPWGNFFDPTWACMRLSYAVGIMRPARVDEFPVDESPYGVRHLAGNVVEWCADEYRREGPPLTDGIYIAPAISPDMPPTDRTLRGGCFLFDAFLLRAATRHNTGSVVRDVTLGFRLVRPFT
jgi:formylglycine-generating enzyme required for sulfatase activity/tRNA A-37 threonylcarbamoyl transferase component Bud32